MKSASFPGTSEPTWLSIYGARISGLIAVSAVAGSALVGTTLGLVSGYFGGWADRVITLAVNLQMSFPFIVLALTMATILGASIQNLILVLVVTTWVSYARLIRGSVLEIRQEEFVQSARALGASHLRILLRHVLPNVVNGIVVLTSLELSRLVVAEASISFLGFGVKPPTPAWGAMLADSRTYVATAWWLSVFPGVALALTALGANLVGDWVRDATDPRLRV